jgi:hypothetical protein
LTGSPQGRMIAGHFRSGLPPFRVRGGKRGAYWGLGPNQSYWENSPSDIGLVSKFLENFSRKKASLPVNGGAGC